MQKMRIGKLTGEELEENVLSLISRRRSEILQSAKIGSDCAAFYSDKIITLTGDPITARCKNSGALAIHVSANDIAASGSQPLAAHLTILAPPKEELSAVAEIMRGAERVCKSLSLEIVGGHTEFTDAVTRIVVSCVMIGLGERCLSSDGIKEGDKLIMTKSAGIEGTIILAERFPEILSEEERLQIETLYDELSVVKDGKAAAPFASAMHDATEGGILGAVCELCAKKGAHVCLDRVRVLSLTQKLCARENLDPYRLLSSGSMLIATDKEESVLNALKKENINAVTIGEVGGGAVTAELGGKRFNVSITPDEICKV